MKRYYSCPARLGRREREGRRKRPRGQQRKYVGLGKYFSDKYSIVHVSVFSASLDNGRCAKLRGLKAGRKIPCYYGVTDRRREKGAGQTGAEKKERVEPCVVSYIHPTDRPTELLCSAL